MDGGWFQGSSPCDVGTQATGDGRELVGVVGVRRATQAIGVGCACVAALIAPGGVTAQATPPDEGEASCVFTLSEPFVVDVSGREMVSATLSGLPCTGNALPNEQTVCVELQGSGEAPQCAYLPGYVTAQVYFAPYRPGSTYVSTGTGCAQVSPTQVQTCTTQGPYTATL